MTERYENQRISPGYPKCTNRSSRIRENRKENILSEITYDDISKMKDEFLNWKGSQNSAQYMEEDAQEGISLLNFKTLEN